jgi:putative transcription antitermination factor YqgF
MADEAASFAARLRKELGLPVELADERLSSWEAEQMAAAGERTKSRPRSTDEVAAAIILRDYLERHRIAGKGQPHR